ncbi:hypothetical protein KMI_06g10350 [Encephalitozoon hellem]|nr:hypothetical protein KMI_06g10350 [Encephalitozoon hellem]
MIESNQKKHARASRCIHLKALDWVCGMYYRYSVETGICVLEWWEAVLVNIYFLLLLSSLTRQIIRMGIYLIRILLRYWPLSGKS